MMTKQDLEKVLDKAKSLKAMVIGDAMLDRYIFGTVDRISPEAPVPILSHQRTELKAGGSANVALNLSAWGCSTSIVGLVGKDSNAQALKVILDDHGILHSLIACDDRPTTIKTRVVASSHHLLRIDEESSTYLEGDEESKMIDEVLSFVKIQKPDMIILQDYNKGMLTPALIERVIDYSRTRNIFLAVDPKEQNFLSYRNVDLFKPNLREACHAVKKSISANELPSISYQWRKDYGFQSVAITLGGQGIYLQNNEGDSYVKPGRSVDIVDVCGAGDAVICSLALGILSGLSLEKCGELANLTGAYVCSHSGVVAVDPKEIMNWVT